MKVLPGTIVGCPTGLGVVTRLRIAKSFFCCWGRGFEGGAVLFSLFFKGKCYCLFKLSPSFFLWFSGTSLFYFIFLRGLW